MDSNFQYAGSVNSVVASFLAPGCVDGPAGQRLGSPSITAGIRNNRPVASRSDRVQEPPTPQIIQCRISQRSWSTTPSSTGSNPGTRAWISTPEGVRRCDRRRRAHIPSPMVRRGNPARVTRPSQDRRSYLHRRLTPRRRGLPLRPRRWVALDKEHLASLPSPSASPRTRMVEYGISTSSMML
jgi:hypothetical protein